MASKCFKQIFKGVLLPAAAVVSGSEEHNLGLLCSKKTNCLCKPSDLPIYPIECPACKKRVIEQPASEIEQTIGQVRKELWVFQDGLKGYKQQVIDTINTGIAHTSSSVDFLREETNFPARYGAIAVGTLTGYIFGLRGGSFKRLTYATIGGLSTFAVCYPRLASEYSEVAAEEGQRYFVAGYHFIFGEKPKTPEWVTTILDYLPKSREDITKPKN